MAPLPCTPRQAGHPTPLQDAGAGGVTLEDLLRRALEGEPGAGAGMIDRDRVHDAGAARGQGNADEEDEEEAWRRRLREEMSDGEGGGRGGGGGADGWGQRHSFWDTGWSVPGARVEPADMAALLWQQATWS